MIFLEAHSSQVSTLVKQIGKGLSRISNNSSSAGEQKNNLEGNFSSSVNATFGSIGGFIVEVFNGIWKSMVEFYGWIGSLFANKSEKGTLFWKGISNFFKGWWDWNIIYLLFKDFHVKLYNIIQFATNKEKRRLFEELFKKEGGSNSWDQTFDAVKLLLGLSLFSGGTTNNKKWPFTVDETLFKLLAHFFRII